MTLPHPARHLAEALGVTMSLASLYLTGKRRPCGPAIGALAGIPWTAFAIANHAPLMLLQTAVTSAIQVRIFIRWRKT